jgi:hypothetical protein
MTVKIAKLRTGEDVICDISEIVEQGSSIMMNNNMPSPERVVAFQFTEPYNVWVDQESAQILLEGSDEPQKINDIRLNLFPWAPLSADRKFVVSLSEVISIYEPHAEVANKYKQLVEAKHGTSESPIITG